MGKNNEYSTAYSRDRGIKPLLYRYLTDLDQIDFRRPRELELYRGGVTQL